MQYWLGLKPGLLAAAALLSLTLGGTASAQNKDNEAPIRGVSVPVTFTVTTDKKTYKSDEPIRIKMVVKNSSQETVNLEFSSTQKYDIEIRQGKARTGAKVWQWARGKMFGQIVTSLALAPSKTITFTDTFDPSTKLSKPPSLVKPESQLKPQPLAPGIYLVLGTLTTMGRAPRPSGGTVITVK
jgi:hypothetical protein